ncbi:MAG: helix-turn-helix domain-containing protein [Phycisphaeraceae bacterium]
MGKVLVSELARRAGVNVETVRYYERRGLLRPASRSASGYRRYGEEELQRLRFILRAKTLGFTLREIKELLELKNTPEATCHDIRQRAQVKVRDIESRIQTLRAMHRALLGLIDQCDNGRDSDQCPILQAMEDTGASTKGADP